MARSRSSADDSAPDFQVPAERPEDSLDLRSDEQKKADEQIAKDYPEKSDDTRDEGASALPADDPRATGEPEAS